MKRSATNCHRKGLGMERTKETLEARVRETPLVDRLKECQKRIGNMCAELRGPKMSIPVEYYDDDFYICTTLADAQATVEALQAQLEQEREKVKGLEKEAERLRIVNRGHINEGFKDMKTIEELTAAFAKAQTDLTQLQALVRALLDTWVNGRKIHDGIPMTLRQQIDATLDATTPATTKT